MKLLAAIVVVLCACPALAEVRTLPVLSATLYPGDAVPPGQLGAKPFTGNSQSFAGFAQQAGEIAGKYARRTIPAGLPIALAALKDRDVVQQGTPVLAVLEEGGLTITATLLALESAAAGQTVKARNPQSGLTVSGVAQADGTLRIAGK